MFDSKMRRAALLEGLKNLRRRYFINILVVFIVAVVVNGGYNLTTGRLDEKSSIPTSQTALTTAVSVTNEVRQNSTMGLDIDLSNASIIRKFIFNVFDINEISDPDSIKKSSGKYYSGVASVFVNEITGSQSFIFGILNGLNELIFKGRVASSVVIFIFALLSIALFIFVKNVIITGQIRYFLEQRRYRDTSPSELLFPYKNKRLKNVTIVLFARYIFQLLWNLTIVGGIIKHYEYILIPYIITENPAITRKEAFAISKQMMSGNKFSVFLLEMELIPLYVLSYFTYNITGLFFSDAYIECVKAEMYMNIRALKKAELSSEYSALINDFALDVSEVTDGVHPSGDETLDFPTVHISNYVSDYLRDYSALSLIELFFTYSLVGWIWEAIFYLASTGEFVNRGTMHGPWLPIYGCGGLLIIFLLKPFRKSPGALFVGAVAVCGSVEYFTSWLLEKLFNEKWWDYTGYFLNINGRVCFEGLIVFGMAGLAFTYFLSPMLDNLYQKMSRKYRVILCTILIVLFVVDLAFSIVHPNIGEGVTSGLV